MHIIAQLKRGRVKAGGRVKVELDLLIMQQNQI